MLAMKKRKSSKRDAIHVSYRRLDRGNDRAPLELNSGFTTGSFYTVPCHGPGEPSPRLLLRAFRAWQPDSATPGKPTMNPEALRPFTPEPNFQRNTP